MSVVLGAFGLFVIVAVVITVSDSAKLFRYFGAASGHLIRTKSIA